MTDTRTVLIGMNNPHGGRPDMALFPWPERCAGWNLWRMLAEVGQSRGLEIFRKHYADAFDRRNVLYGTEWSKADARRAAEDLLPTLAGRRVIVLGAETADVLGLPRTELGEWAEAHVRSLVTATFFDSPVPITEQTAQPDRMTYTYLPHPSGRNRVYNDNDTRWRAGIVLLREFMASEVAKGLALRPPAG